MKDEFYITGKQFHLKHAILEATEKFQL